MGLIPFCSPEQNPLTTSVGDPTDQHDAGVSSTWKIDSALTDKYLPEEKSPNRLPKYGKAQSDFAIPEGATSVKIVAVYTDIFDGPAGENVPATAKGDAAAIIASWTDTLKDGKWDFTTNTKDIADRYIPGSEPEYGPEVTKRTEAIVKSMNASLVHLREAAETVVRPAKDGKEDNEKNTVNTGYDIQVK